MDKIQATVLYVEDDEFIRKFIARVLSRRIEHLEIAENGEIGLEKYRQFHPNLIVSDIKMPLMDGLQMARVIKEENPSFPIVITSAHDDKEILDEAKSIGIDKYLFKPVKTDELLESIETLLAKS